MNKKQSVMAAGILAVLCCLFCSMCAGVLLARYFAASQKRILTEVTPAWWKHIRRRKRKSCFW